MKWLDGITDSLDVSLGKLQSWWWTGRTGVLQSMGSQRVGHDWVTELYKILAGSSLLSRLWFAEISERDTGKVPK